MQKSLPVFYYSSVLLFYFWTWGISSIHVFDLSSNNKNANEIKIEKLKHNAVNDIFNNKNIDAVKWKDNHENAFRNHVVNSKEKETISDNEIIDKPADKLTSNIVVNGITCSSYQFSGNLKGTRDRGAANNDLNRDFVFGDGYAFKVDFDNLTEVVIETTIGDALIARVGTVTVDGIAKSINTNANNFQTVTHTPTLSNSYTIDLIGFDLTVNSIVFKTPSGDLIAGFDFGTATSVVSPDYIGVDDSVTSATACPSLVCDEEICGNGIDDDGDGLIDQLDDDCCSFPATITTQAEDVTTNGGVAIRSDNAGFNGIGYADYPGSQGSGVNLSWSENVSSGGNFYLTIRYALNGTTSARPLNLYVNGVLSSTFNLTGTGGWSSYQTVTNTVTLITGINNFVLAADAGSVGPNVDEMMLTLCGVEICDNGIDDDGDGLTDCNDSDCVVSSVGSIAGNEIDCGAYNPSQISNAGDAIGFGTIQYQWQTSTDGVMWADFSAATLKNFDPPTVSQTTYYRRGARNEFCTTWSYSSVVIKEVVFNFTNAGQLIGTESGCDAYNPSAITTTNPSGGSGGTTSYQWQYRNDGGSWNNISGATNADYDPPLISKTTEYRRGVRRSPCTNFVFSNIIEKEVLGGSGANINNFPNGNLCSNVKYDFAAQDAGAGIIHTWNFGPYASQANATGTGVHQVSFDVPKTTPSTDVPVELIITDNGCEIRDTVDVTVFAGIDTNSISVVNPSTCITPNGNITIDADYYAGNNIEVSIDGGTTWGAINQLAFNGLDVGTFDIQIRYVGQSCVFDFGSTVLTDATADTLGINEDLTVVCDELTYTFSSIIDPDLDSYSWDFGVGASPANATGAGPHDVTFTTFGNKTVNLTTSKDGCDNAYSETFEITQNVTDGGQVGTDQFLCGFTDPTVLINISNATGGTGGTISYQWQVRTRTTLSVWGNWNDIPTVTSLSYDPPSLSEETQFRRMASRTSCEGVPSNVITVTPSSEPDANVINFISVCPGQAYSNDASTNDSNIINPAFTIFTPAQNGTVNIFEDGTFIYEPNSLFCGVDKFVYQVCNDKGTCCDTATVNLDLNDQAAPVLFDIPEAEFLHCDEEVPTPPFVLALENCLQVELGLDEVSTQGLSNCELNNYEITRVWTATDYCGLSTNDSQTITVEDVNAPGIYRVYTLPNGTKMIGGFIDNVGERWKHVTLPITFATKPVIFTQVVSDNDVSATSVQLKAVSKSQFDIRLMDEEANDTRIHGRERIAWIAMEEGTGSLNNPFEVSSLPVDSNPQTINFSQPFSTTPVFIANTQTAFSSEPVEIRVPNLNASNASVFLQEDESADLETTHSIEGVGYAAFDQVGNLELSSGEIFGETGKASFGGDVWTEIPLSHGYKNPIVIATVSTQNDSEPVAVRVRNVTPSSFYLKIDGWDYISSTHGVEEISYVVIEGSIPFDQSVSCDAVPDPLTIGTEIVTVDNCDIAVNIVFTETPNANSCAPDNVISRTWYVEDECGNSVSYSREISVYDLVDPEFTVPADVTIQCEDDINDLTLTGDVVDETDNCATGIEATYVDSQTGSIACDSSVTIVRSWTLHDNCGNSVTKHQNISVIHQGVQFDAKIKLQGALFDINGGLMRDDLRSLGLLPTTEPYSDIASYQHIGGGGETVAPSVFTATGANAIVDWVFVEIRNAIRHDSVIGTRSALLQRDGDIVDVDGMSPVNFTNVQPGQYNFSVRHRNHLGAVTLYPKRLKNEPQTEPFDFTTNVVIDPNDVMSAFDFDGDSLVYICENTDTSEFTLLESIAYLDSLITPNSTMTCGPCGTFKTIKDGNWSDISTWENGNIPSIPISEVEVIINHAVDISDYLEVGNDALLWIDNGALNVTNHFKIVGNGIVYALDSDITLGDQMFITNVPTNKPKFVMYGGQLKIGANYQNNGGDIVFRNVCINAALGYENIGGNETYTDVQVELQNGDYTISTTNSNTFLNSTTSRFKLYNGSFINEDQFIGIDNILWMVNGGIQNNGTWGSTVANYCISDTTTNLVNGELPLLQDCANIDDNYNDFICGDVVDSLIVDNIIANPDLPQIGTWGTHAMQINPNGNALWAGDYDSDRQTIFQGPSNDISDLFVKVVTDSDNVNALPNFIRKAYDAADIDLNGDVIFQGPNNERAKLLFNTILVNPGNIQFLPNYIILEQIPR